MSHGKRNQKAFRRGSLKRKVAREQKDNARFEAETQRIIDSLKEKKQ
jgi:hypothetical protein